MLEILGSVVYLGLIKEAIPNLTNFDAGEWIFNTHRFKHQCIQRE